MKGALRAHAQAAYTLRHWEREEKQAGGKRGKGAWRQQQRKTSKGQSWADRRISGEVFGLHPLFRERIFKKTICSKCLHYFHRMISIGKGMTSITKLQDFRSFPHFFIQSSVLKCQTDNNDYHAYCHKSLSTAFKEIASQGPDKSFITQVARKGVGGGGPWNFSLLTPEPTPILSSASEF